MELLPSVTVPGLQSYILTEPSVIPPSRSMALGISFGSPQFAKKKKKTANGKVFSYANWDLGTLLGNILFEN